MLPELDAYPVEISDLIKLVQSISVQSLEYFYDDQLTKVEASDFKNILNAYFKALNMINEQNYNEIEDRDFPT